MGLRESINDVDVDWRDALPVGKPLTCVVANFILATLAHCNYNRTHAAKMLGLSRRSIMKRIAELKAQGYEVPDSQWTPKKSCLGPFPQQLALPVYNRYK